MANIIINIKTMREIRFPNLSIILENKREPVTSPRPTENSQ